MDKQKKKIIVAVAVMACVAAIAIGGYYFLSKRLKNAGAEGSKPETEVEKLLEKDLETKYPETPAEVVKLYWRFNKCMYNEKMSDEDFEGLLKQLRLLYSDEFLTEEENSWDNMLENFRKDRDDYQSSGKIIAMYSVEANSATNYGEIDDDEYATIMTNTMLKQKSERTKVYEKFMCRREEDDNWKIVGWEQIDSKDVE